MLTAAETAEELRLWADYYEARSRALDIMRREGTSGAALSDIVAQDTLACSTLARIKEIRAGTEPGGRRTDP
jgi:hypothetical protein